MNDSEFDGHIESVRRFNRLYTRQIGLLQESYLRSSLPLAEVRVIYELAHRENSTATELGADLELDPGYLSRLLRDAEKRGLIRKQRSATDGRQTRLSLTEQGRETFATFDIRSRQDIGRWLSRLPERDQTRLIKAMHTIEGLLGASSGRKAPYLLRSHQPGDMGWIIHRHAVLYADEYGWDAQFEALVAGIAAEFIRRFNPKREHCWMAEIDGEIVGSVVLVEKSETVAKLRLLLVEPKVRGLGIGRRLVDECTRFARQAAYKKITLWTNNNLIAARQLYVRAGYKLIAEELHHSFGHDLVGETWELDL